MFDETDSSLIVHIHAHGPHSDVEFHLQIDASNTNMESSSDDNGNDEDGEEGDSDGQPESVSLLDNLSPQCD